MIKKLALLAGVALAMAASQVMAQGYRSELSAFGNYTRMHQSDQSTSFSMLDVGYGYYFSPQLVGTLNITRVSSNSFGYTDLGLGAKYYFGVGRRSSFVPFVDGNIGIQKAPSQHDRRWQFGFGGAYFVTEATSFDVGMHLFQVSSTPYITNGTIFGMGFTTRF
ncbi:MAG TPA: hypothetical protein VF943_02525 [Burkholderiales bacterium]